ncbi:MAG: DUF4012 domain-containing protein [Mycobacteriales bacterium]|nr:DUF4012 domain-containing protein [Mycobacteriales bacterium]
MTRRRRALVLVAVLATLLLGVGSWLAARGVMARDELLGARADLATARAALMAHRNEAADVAIERAATRTRRAVALMHDPVFRAAARLPLVGRSVRVGQEVASAAEVVAADILPDALVTARALDPSLLRRPDGSVDVIRLRAASPRVTQLSVRATALARQTAGLPRARVLGVVDRGRDDMLGQLDELAEGLDNASRAVRLAPVLLGADRPRRYFVLVQQTSESRGTGGLLGGFAVLEARSGRVTVSAQGSTADLRNGPVRVPAEVPQDYRDLYTADGIVPFWQNINLSPDLPMVAKVVAARWTSQTGQTIDGVVALDAIALSDILSGSGLVDLGNRTIRPEQLPEYLAVGQYREFVTLAERRARKDKLAAVSQAVTSRLTRGGGSSANLVRGLAKAVSSGHLRMASEDPALGPELREAGIDGGLPRGPAPVAYPVVYNSSAGKLDYFLDRHVRYTVGSCDGERRASTIEVRLRNSAPATGLPPYLTIDYDGHVERQSYDASVVLSVYGTQGALLDTATLDGEPVSLLPTGPGGPFLTPATESGLPLWYLDLDLPRGTTRTLTLHLDEPVVGGPPRLPEQPLARSLEATTSGPTC